MTDAPAPPGGINLGSQSESGYSHYNPVSVTLHNTLGLVFLGLLALALLIALLRQQARYHDLAMRVARLPE